MGRVGDPPIGPIEPDYSFFEFLVGRVKQSAIDAYVCREYEMHIVDDHYEHAVSSSEDEWVFRPRASGEGGGELAWVNGQHPDLEERERLRSAGVTSAGGLTDDVGWLANFLHSESLISGKMDDIRSRVDAIVSRWRLLPEPWQIREQVDAWQEVYKAIDMPESSGGDSLLLNVSRVRDLVNGDPEHYLAPALMAGSAADLFKKFIDNLYDAVVGCGDITLTLGVSMAAECKLWTAARQDVATILSHTIEVLDKIAAGGSADYLANDYAAAGFFLAAIGLFTDGLGTVAVTGLSVGLTALSSADGEPSSSEKVNGYSSVLDALDILLNSPDRTRGLGGRVTEAEDDIRRNIIDNIDAVNANRSVFDPTPGPIESTDGIRRPEQGVLDQIYSLMDDIAGQLTWVGDRVRGCASTVNARVGQLRRHAPMRGSLLGRDPDVGIGAMGPTDDFVALADRLGTLAYELEWEAAEGRKNLKAAMDFLDQADAAAQAALAQIAAEVAAGYDGDGQ